MGVVQARDKQVIGQINTFDVGCRRMCRQQVGAVDRLDAPVDHEHGSWVDHSAITFTRDDDRVFKQKTGHWLPPKGPP